MLPARHDDNDDVLISSLRVYLSFCVVAFVLFLLVKADFLKLSFFFPDCY